MPGVGRITALAFYLAIENPERFKSSRALGAYFGLRPRIRESGQQRPQLGITKAGNQFLRRLLVQCAHHVLSQGPDSDLKRWGLAYAERGAKNARKRAVVAVARKIAVVLHRLWSDRAEYQPLRRAAA